MAELCASMWLTILTRPFGLLVWAYSGLTSIRIGLPRGSVALVWALRLRGFPTLRFGQMQAPVAPAVRHTSATAPVAPSTAAPATGGIQLRSRERVLRDHLLAAEAWTPRLPPRDHREPRLPSRESRLLPEHRESPRIREVRDPSRAEVRPVSRGLLKRARVQQTGSNTVPLGSPPPLQRRRNAPAADTGGAGDSIDDMVNQQRSRDAEVLAAPASASAARPASTPRSVAKSAGSGASSARTRRSSRAVNPSGQDLQRHQKRWDSFAKHRAWSGLLGRTYNDSSLYAVWPWRPVGDAKSPLELPRDLQSLRGGRVGSGCPSTEMRTRAKDIVRASATETVQGKMSIKLPLTEDDVSFDAPDADYCCHHGISST